MGVSSRYTGSTHLSSKNARVQNILHEMICVSVVVVVSVHFRKKGKTGKKKGRLDSSGGKIPVAKSGYFLSADEMKYKISYFYTVHISQIISLLLFHILRLLVLAIPRLM